MFKKTKKSLLQKIGPGFITGAADDDPSGIGTYTQVGAQFGFSMLWTAIFTFPLMYNIQEMVARLSMVSGQGVTSLAKKYLPRWIVIIFIALIAIANIINIGSDLGAMAASWQLIFPNSSYFYSIIVFALLIIFLVVYIPYHYYSSVLKILCLTLLSYLLTVIIVTEDWMQLVQNIFTPKLVLNKEFFFSLVAVLGTTISPYLFIWQSSEEVEEEIDQGRLKISQRKGASLQDIKEMRRDTIFGMSFSQLIMLCIIATSANAFFRNGLFEIGSAAEAAQALEPLAGRFASLIFAFGIIGTGLLAVPILAAAVAYCFCELFNWPEGLSKKFFEAKFFYLIIIISTVIGLLLNFIGLNPIKALFYTAFINGICTPPLILIILSLANNRRIMGKMANNHLSNFLGWLLVALTLVSILLIFVL